VRRERGFLVGVLKKQSLSEREFLQNPEKKAPMLQIGKIRLPTKGRGEKQKATCQQKSRGGEI